MDKQEIIAAIALTKLKGIGPAIAKTMLEETNSASDIFMHKKDLRSVFPDATDYLLSLFANTDDAMRSAEQEMEFLEKKNVRALVLTADDYPQRLKACDDAPTVLFYCGKADLNRSHIINIIGTRKSTEYGKDVCNNFIADLKRYYPDTLIVSGLAYGTDVNAHRAALENGMDTVGVLAHGLDIMYPYAHRKTAADMIHAGGGLLTEYTIKTTPEKMNFVRRNRIVAGMSDACIVVESAERGGSLITASMALDYGREVFAFPGRVYDSCSIGCNNLIKNHQATLITCAEDLINNMGWENPLEKCKNPKAIQQELFVELSREEQAIVNLLKNTEDKHINDIAAETGISYSNVSTLLFELEMKGLVAAIGGSRYRAKSF